jgi:hypothetical protein
MQTKREFLNNVQYHAHSLDEYMQQEKDDAATLHPVDLDPELKAMFDEASLHQRLMFESAIRLARRCREKLELTGGGQ